MIEKIREEPKFEKEFLELERVLKVAKDLGFKIREYDRETIIRSFEDRLSLPIVHDGLDGIRIVRKREGGIKFFY